MYLAFDPLYYIPLQTGWLWIFTPVKGSVVALGWYSTNIPWYDLYLYDSHYLDLRVAALDLVLLVVLTIAIPSWCHRQRLGRLWAFLSATTGLLFGLAVAVIGFFALSTGSVMLASVVIAGALYLIALRMIVFRRQPRSSRAGKIDKAS